MFFKNKIEIYSNRIPINFVKQFFTIYPHNLPSYFKNIPKIFPYKIGRNFNVRTCSGFINFFRRSIVFKSPFDITLEYRDNQVFCEFGSGSYSNEKNLAVHLHEQFLKWTNSDKYKLVVKLLFGITLKCDSSILLTNPWWSMNSFETIPGILNAKAPIQMNLFLPFKKQGDRINIRQGTPLCMMHFENNKNLKLIFKNSPINERNYNGLEYLKTNLKNIVLPNNIKN